MAMNESLNAAPRRILYGANVAVTVVLAVVLMAIVNWAAGRFGGQIDMTRAGVNSLSPRTVQLVRSLDRDVTITSLFSVALKEIRPHAEKHKQLVADLLDLYENAGRGRVAVFQLDPGQSPERVDELLKRLADKPAYRDEAKPHAESLARFPELGARVSELVQSELARVEDLVRADQRLNRVPELAIIARLMRQTVGDIQAALGDVETLKTEAIPRYGAALDIVRDTLNTTRSGLQSAVQWMTQDAQGLEWMAEDARAFFLESAPRYQTLLEAIDAELASVQDLKPVELEQLYESLKAGQTILVETDEKARVLTQEDVLPFRADRNAPAPPDGDLREFAGEAAVSSAILQLTQKDKTAIVFARYGGSALLAPDFSQMNPMAPPPEAPFGRLGGILEKENFQVAEWDVQMQPDPPVVEGAARTVYVVFPPREPQSPNPMQPPREPPITDEQKQKILDAARGAGMAIFLVGWQPPANPMIPMAPEYAFAEQLKSEWGIEVSSKHLAVEFTPNPQREGVWVPASRNPLVLTSEAIRFTEHAIGRPLQSLPVGLQAAAPLRLAAPAQRPAGVTLETIAETPASDDIWAISDLARTEEDFEKRQGTQRYDDDVAAPFAVGVAASNDKGQRLVVISSEQFASDAVLDSASLVQIGNVLQLAQSYPGNADLFLNAVHWLTGDADRISVGPQRGAVPRLDRLKEGPVATFLSVFFVGIWPGLALAAGALVWFTRRR